MINSCVDSALNGLARLSRESRMSSHMKNQIQTLQLELRFLKMFCWCSAKWNGAVKNVMMGSALESNIEATLGDATHRLFFIGFHALYTREFQDWELAVLKLHEEIDHCKSKVKEICLGMTNFSFQCKFSSKYKLLRFLHFVLWNMKDFVRLKDDVIPAALKVEINALQEKLSFITEFYTFSVKRCIFCDEFRDLMICIQGWAYKAACLTILFWIEKEEQETKIILSGLLQKMRPCAPEVIRIYFEALKASKFPRSDTFLMAAVVSSLVDFLLEFVVVLANDDVKILREGLIFFLTFLMDPPEEYAEDGKLVPTETDAIINKAVILICSLSVGELEQRTSSKGGNILLSDFMEKINKFKAEVRQLHVQILSLSHFDFPITNELGFIDFLLANLKELLESKANCIPFAKHQIQTVHDELMSLRPFLNEIWQQQGKYEELKDLWMRIIYMAYEAEHVIDSCSTIDAPIWYNLIRLSDIIAGIQSIKIAVKKTRGQQIYSTRVHCDEINPSHILPAQASTSSKDEVIIGFIEETKAIIDRLTRGSTRLDIVSIVGMPGLGKTTLAKKVYNDPSVRYHFNKRAWCCVSQVHTSRELLHCILNDIGVHKHQTGDKIVEELAEHVYKCLKGQRYLIVMDDIWDIRAWNELKESFPNDYNGSRVMFTSRIHKVALQAKLDNTPYLLRPFSDEESWELLQKKIFGDDCCPPNLSKIGKLIAKNCKGLPIAVVVTAGLLARKGRNLDWWKEIADSLSSQIAGEGCTGTIELSYTHLPDLLKPCFLYFGAFREDHAIKAQKLIQLWIAEGFVQKIGTKTMEDVAKEYLLDLTDRSLVIVAKRSSTGGIKECFLHDLLHDFCLNKFQEERFLHIPNVSQDSSKTKYDQYRLSIHAEWRAFVNSAPTASCVRSLLFNGDRERVRYLLSTANRDRHPNISSFFIRFKLLRVLDLEDVALATVDFLKHITSLVHLRYLSVSGSIYCVPPTIENLWNLEIFRLKSSFVTVKLPKNIWKMKALKHVRVHRYAIILLDDDELEEPPDQLDNVETFTHVCFDSEENAGKQLRRLPNVRHLGIQLRYNACVPLSRLLCKLEALHLSVTYEACCPWPFDFPSTLKKLTLTNLRIRQSHMSAIGNLSNLEVLRLISVDFECSIWDMEDEEFLNLQFLKFQNCRIVEWNASTDHFPCLERLAVKECYRLKEIPSSFGDINTLKIIEVRGCSNNLASSARQILRDQLDMGNEGSVALIIDGQEINSLEGEHCTLT